MKKVPTLFLRDPENPKRVTDKVNPDCQWVLNGEGIATRKYDGTCCLIRDGKLYKRYEARYHHKNSLDLVNGDWTPVKTLPDGYEPADDVDENTGKRPGWVPVGNGPEDKFHREALLKTALVGGTYELVGPKVQGNPEGFEYHHLIAHHQAERAPALDKPQSFEQLATALTNLPWEGVVWHHPDGRYAKLKRKDFT